MPVNDPQEFIDTLAESLALLPPETTFLHLKLNQLPPTPSYLSISKTLGALKKCVKLKLDFSNSFFDELALDELANSISNMRFLAVLSLKLTALVLSPKAAEALAGLF